MNQIKAFKLKVKKENEETLQDLTRIEVKHDFEIEQMTDGYTALSQAQEYLDITFEPVKKASKIQIQLQQSTIETVTINEVLIPRKCFYHRQVI